MSSRTCTPAGTLAGGAACTSSAQCASGVCTFEGSGCGACEAVIPLGRPCGTGIPGVCAPDASCKAQPDATGRCSTPGVEGDACASDYECNDDLACSGGKCTARVADGTSCTDSTLCRDDSYCSSGAGSTCVPIPVTGSGAPCGVDVASLRVAFCAVGSKCIYPSATSTTGRCGAPLAQGAACVSFGPALDPCGDGLVCATTGTSSSETCQPATCP